MTLAWAVGNLVADGNGGCKIGAPEDGGLYFQFGSLIGWSGGATGDGTGRGTDNTTLALSVAVNNTGAGPAVGTTSWVATAGTTYWGGSSGTVPLTSTGAVGDPCRHYMGGTWRLPTQPEISALFGNVANGTAWSSVANWASSGTFSSGSTDSYALYTNGSTTLKLPASGVRDHSSGALSYVGSGGYYWNATVSSETYGCSLYFGSTHVNPSTSSNRAYGFPVRCIRE